MRSRVVFETEIESTIEISSLKCVRFNDGRSYRRVRLRPIVLRQLQLSAFRSAKGSLRLNHESKYSSIEMGIRIQDKPLCAWQLS